MVTAITLGVKISVETTYQEEHSNPGNGHFMFAYRIIIENLTDYAIQLKRRQWFIFDSNGSQREVEGEGVVGEQPVIEAGQRHSYISACNLNTDMGSMSGNYLMRRIFDEKDFIVDIPEFELIVPYRLN
ncbi:MAG: Co2+/Mg2+ efflux protein ApaG [Candidatus Pedobacter colombiensis]|uniref:Co2+/Mg2+ efflux protein ApaG n=1 Tax=Candidatus Pedobacter colombiensis TaxID=3121371 RepID=A0AAJ5W8U1_9SPHI|nr:Co2+/Mg2+ efflux protein ApaG [Pedobacter sp.]WEK19333.1 MAG: Co2+/Mg2+ efflux protein ApaG [Pedobacter sp.]